MALDELRDSESTSHEWLQSCVSRNIQIDLPVAHHTKIFEGVCVRDLDGWPCVNSLPKFGGAEPQ
jgi:hypothetical protein